MRKKSNFTASPLFGVTWVFILWSAENGKENTQREYFIRKTKENGTNIYLSFAMVDPFQKYS